MLLLVHHTENFQRKILVMSGRTTDEEYINKVFSKWAKEDTPLDTLIVAKLLLKGHSCEDCNCTMFSNYLDSCFHDRHIKKIVLNRGRGVCALWGKFKQK